MKQLIEWTALELRVSGEKLNALLREMLGTKAEPIERIELQFTDGLLRVVGSIRKFISIPFTAEVREIQARGTTVRVAISGASAAGFPIPTLLFRFAKDRLPRDLVAFQEPATLVIALERFLPTFVSADIRQIRIVDGGLAVTLGPGGADLPSSVPSSTPAPTQASGGSHATDI